MNKVLIVAGERQTGEHYQRALGQDGFQTAVVWNPIQMVEFCRQHRPDFILVDLDLAELGLWSAIQAVREVGGLATVPFLGLASAPNPPLIEKVRAAGFVSVLPTQESSRQLLTVLRGIIERGQEPVSEEDEMGNDPALNRLRVIAREIVETSQALRVRIAEFGEDGPELFGYIESSGVAIRKKLRELADFSLHDRELRHDFRNMIGSVTGFAELILMESGLSRDSTEGLTFLRRHSKEFVDILDMQRAEANA